MDLTEAIEEIHKNNILVYATDVVDGTDFRTLSKNEKEKYVLWQNQYLIYEVLGDGERSEFWMSYADRSVVEKHNLGQPPRPEPFWPLRPHCIHNEPSPVHQERHSRCPWKPEHRERRFCGRENRQYRCQWRWKSRLRLQFRQWPP